MWLPDCILLSQGGDHIKLLFSTSLVVLLVLAGGCAGRQAVNIHLRNGNEQELRAEAQLRRLLREYDLTPWIFTREIMIDQWAIPHSHPILTLHTRVVEDDNRQLSVFLHEQVHWFLVANEAAFLAAIDDLREMYPEVPVGGPEGAESEFSTYLHLIVCWFEHDAMIGLVGPEQARRVLEGHSHYTWIYKRVFDDNEKIGVLIRNHGLVIDPSGRELPPVL